MAWKFFQDTAYLTPTAGWVFFEHAPVTIVASSTVTIVEHITDASFIFTDSNVVIEITQRVIDGITISDSHTSKAEYTVSFSDSFNFTDLITNTVLLEDILTLTDTTSHIAEVKNTQTDAVLLGDSVGTVLNTSFSRSETVTLTDAIVFGQIFAETITTDSFDVTDSIPSEVVIPGESRSDSLTLTDIATDIYETLATGASIIVLSDVADSSRSLPSDASETLVLTDSITFRVEYIITQSDSISITDNRTDISNFIASLSETLAISDSLIFHREIKQQPQDLLIWSDTFSTFQAFEYTQTDDLQLRDSVTSNLIATASSSSIMALEDEMFFKLRAVEDIFDNTVLTDSNIAYKTSLILALGSIALSDQVLPVVNATITASDSVALGSSILLVSAIRPRTGADSFLFLDGSFGFVEFRAAVSDTISFDDSTAQAIETIDSRLNIINLSSKITAYNVMSAAVLDGFVLTDSTQNRLEPVHPVDIIRFTDFVDDNYVMDPERVREGLYIEDVSAVITVEEIK